MDKDEWSEWVRTSDELFDKAAGMAQELKEAQEIIDRLTSGCPIRDGEKDTYAAHRRIMSEYRREHDKLLAQAIHLEMTVIGLRKELKILPPVKIVPKQSPPQTEHFP